MENMQPETVATEVEQVVEENKKPKSRKKLIVLISVLLAAVIVIGAGIGVFCYATNNYKTPLRALEKLVNAEEINLEDAYKMLFNGAFKDEVADLYETIMKSEKIQEAIDEGIEYYEDNKDNVKDEYGDDYKITLEIDYEERLEKEDLREFKNVLKQIGEALINAAEIAEDYDAEQWEDLAEELGVNKAQAKDIIKKLKELGKAIKSAEVTDGYDLDVIATISGEDGDDEEEIDLCVYKVNGRWILGEIFTGIFGY